MSMSQGFFYKCEWGNGACNYTTKRKDNFEKHCDTHTKTKRFECKFPDCDKAYTDKSNLNRHIYIVHDKKTFSCKNCLQEFKSTTLLYRHKERDNCKTEVMEAGGPNDKKIEQVPRTVRFESPTPQQQHPQQQQRKSNMIRRKKGGERKKELSKNPVKRPCSQSFKHSQRVVRKVVRNTGMKKQTSFADMRKIRNSTAKRGKSSQHTIKKVPVPVPVPVAVEASQFQDDVDMIPGSPSTQFQAADNGEDDDDAQSNASSSRDIFEDQQQVRTSATTVRPTCDHTFLLRVWRMRKAMNNEFEDDFKNKVRKLLVEGGKGLRAKEFADLCSDKRIESCIGLLPIGLTVLQYIQALGEDYAAIFEFFQIIKSQFVISDELKSLVYHGTAFLMQKSLPKIFSRSHALYMRLPREMRLSFCNRQLFPKGNVAEAQSEVGRQLEALKLQIKETLRVMIEMTICCGVKLPLSRDDEIVRTDSKCYWNMIAESCVEKFCAGRRIDIHKDVIMNALYVDEGTTTCGVVYNNKRRIEIKLHPEVLLELKQSRIKCTRIVEASRHEVSDFIKLVYARLRQDKETLPKPVTPTLFNLAEVVGLDAWGFFIGENFDANCFSKQTYLRLLTSALVERRKDPIISFVSKPHREMGGNELLQVISKHDKDTIEFLFRACGDNLLEEIQKYKILVYWSHKEAKVECTDIDNPDESEDVKTYFNNVKHLLDMNRLQPEFDNLIVYGYITYEDVNI